MMKDRDRIVPLAKVKYIVHGLSIHLFFLHESKIYPVDGKRGFTCQLDTYTAQKSQ